MILAIGNDREENSRLRGASPAGMDAFGESSSYCAANSGNISGDGDEVTLETLVSGDIKTIKERLKKAGQEETMFKLKEEFKTLQDGSTTGNGCSGGRVTTSERLLNLQQALQQHVAMQGRLLKDSFANYLEILIAMRYSLKTLYLTKNSKRTIGDLVEILMGERCLNCCSLLRGETFCRGCMCAICKTFDEELVVDRFRNKTKTGRWLQCSNAKCGCYVHADGAIEKKAVVHVSEPLSADDEVQLVCPICQTRTGMWEHLKDILTQGAGAKKKDMGKLMEELQRAVRMAKGAKTAPYKALLAKISELQLSNEGINKVVAELRGFFGVPDRRASQHTSATLRSPPPSSEPNPNQDSQLALPQGPASSTYGGPFTPAPPPPLGIVGPISEGVPATSGNFLPGMHLPFPPGFMSNMAFPFNLNNRPPPFLPAQPRGDTWEAHDEKPGLLPAPAAAEVRKDTLVPPPVTPSSTDPSRPEASGSSHAVEQHAHEGNAVAAKRKASEMAQEHDGRRVTVKEEVSLQLTEGAPFPAMQAPVEQAFIAAIVAKLEGRIKELAHKRAQLQAMETSLQGRAATVQEIREERQRRKEEVEELVRLKQQEALELEKLAAAAREAADVASAGQEANIARIEAEFEDREEAEQNGIVEEEQARDMLAKSIEEEEARVKEMEREKGTMVAKVREVMQHMVLQLHTWGTS